MSRWLYEVRLDSDLEWVTSHAWRKTTASILDGSGVTARIIADQLGHSRVSMTQDVYMARKVRGTGAGYGEAGGHADGERDDVLDRTTELDALTLLTAENRTSLFGAPEGATAGSRHLTVV